MSKEEIDEWLAMIDKSGRVEHDTFLTGTEENLRTYVAEIDPALRPDEGHAIMLDRMEPGSRQ
jgi:hypothetical protein